MSSHDRFDDHDSHGHQNDFDQFFFDFFHRDHDDHHHRLPVTQLDATLDATATNGSGNTLNGSGNPIDGWEIQNQGSFQLAADVHYRTGDTVQPVAVTDDGLLVYSMPAGSQVNDPGHGVSSDASNRAATSFDWSFDTGAGPGTHQTIQQFLASGGEFFVKIDLDPGQHDNPLTLHAVYDPTDATGSSGVVWEDAHNNIIIRDDGGNDYVTQNSQNYAFYQSLIDTDPHTHGIQTGQIGPDGVFDIEEQIVAPHDNVVADIHSVLQIGDGTLQSDPHDVPATELNATLDVSATDGHGHIFNGSGNPASGWEVQDNGAFELGTDVHYRQGDTVQPSAVTDQGTLVYNMPAGAQVADPTHHVPADSHPPHAATSFDYSFDTGVGAGTHQTIAQFLASGGEFIFKIDLNPGQQNDPLTLHAVYDPTHATGSSGVVWEDAHHNIVIGDDAGNAYVTQNSQNYAFYQSVIDTDPHTPGVQTGQVGPAGTFDVEAQIVSPHHDMIADVHSTLLLA